MRSAMSLGASQRPGGCGTEAVVHVFLLFAGTEELGEFPAPPQASFHDRGVDATAAGVATVAAACAPHALSAARQGTISRFKCAAATMGTEIHLWRRRQVARFS